MPDSPTLVVVPPTEAEIVAALDAVDREIVQQRERRRTPKEIVVREVTLSDLHQRAGELCKQAATGITIYITNHGRRIAKLEAIKPVKPITYNPRTKPRPSP